MGIKNPTPEVGQNSQSVQIDNIGFDATEHCSPHNDKVAKRAVWEAFSFRVLESGNVEVINGSHANPSDHVYHVVCDDEGVPKWCLKSKGKGQWDDCPARKYHCDHDSDEVCKHCWAVANQPSIVAAVRSIKQSD